MVNASIVISNTSFNIPSDNFNYTTVGGGLCTGVFAEYPAEIEDPGEQLSLVVPHRVLMTGRILAHR